MRGRMKEALDKLEQAGKEEKEMQEKINQRARQTIRARFFIDLILFIEWFFIMSEAFTLDVNFLARLFIAFCVTVLNAVASSVFKNLATLYINSEENE